MTTEKYAISIQHQDTVEGKKWNSDGTYTKQQMCSTSNYTKNTSKLWQFFCFVFLALNVTKQPGLKTAP